VGIRHAAGSNPAADLDPDLANAAKGIGVAAGLRLRDLAPALRPALEDGSEPVLVIEDITLEPEDPADAITLIACMQAHDAYVAARGRRDAASPGALAIARILAWAARAEMLGRAPDVRWIGPPTRVPGDVTGHAVTAQVRLSGPDGPVRAAATAIVA
jgi:hypothetical protein